MADNSLKTARNIGDIKGRRIQRGFVGRLDIQDYYRFTISDRSSFNLSLSSLKANVDVQLLNSKGGLIRFSARRGKQSERIQATLNKGTYYVRVLRRSGNTAYRLELAASAISTPPTPTPIPQPAPTPIPQPTPGPSPQRTSEWIRQIPTDNPAAATAAYNYSDDLAIDSAGNVFVSGYSTSPINGGNQAGFEDAWFAKYDNAGNQLWIRRIATSSNDYIRGLVTDASGNVYLAGKTKQTSSIRSAGFIAKYDENGNQLWIDTSLRSSFIGDSPEATDIAIDSSGNLYVTGITYGALGGNDFGNFDAWVAKYNSNGDRLWIQQLGTSGFDTSTSIDVDSLGNVYIGGETPRLLGASNAGGSGDAWFAKYSTNGTLQWVRQFGTSGVPSEEVTGIVVDSLDNIYLTGSTTGAPGELWSENKPWLVKYSSNGDRLWSTQFGTVLTGSVNLTVDKDNNVYTVGRTQDAFGSSSGGWNAYFAKFNSAGVVQWGEVLTTPSEDRTSSIAVDNLGRIYVSGITGGSLGRTNPRSPVWDVWVAKYSS